MTTLSQCTDIEITVGELPEWYNESEHDYAFEAAIEKHWAKGTDANVTISYIYSGLHIAQGWDDDGNLVFERNVDLDYAFEQAKNS